ncbi:Hypothetical predicted protein, partial [Olea europaea subsp. europaea]
KEITVNTALEALENICFAVRGLRGMSELFGEYLIVGGESSAKDGSKDEKGKNELVH